MEHVPSFSGTIIRNGVPNLRNMFGVPSLTPWIVFFFFSYKVDSAMADGSKRRQDQRDGLALRCRGQRWRRKAGATRSAPQFLHPPLHDGGSSAAHAHICT